MQNSSLPKIPSVNFHLWEPCNMRCGFCFATFQDVKQTVLPKGHLPKDDALRIVKLLADAGFQKITFAGGEPTLCPWLTELIVEAKNAGMTTMIVTNGTGLSNSFLKQNREYLDWIAISIDSISPETNMASGRAISGNRPLSLAQYQLLIAQIHQFGYNLKINTVINRLNYLEDLNEFIRFANPKRWKVLQALPIVGQNDRKIDAFKISQQEFNFFLHTHRKLHHLLVPETNSQILGSYVMVDPAGRFFDNFEEKHRYSMSILEVGAQQALTQVHYDALKFQDRGGIYDW
ncbi:MAG TPA: viperin family antiviral radical SAM protein [Bacteroidia bacterium]|nr:viperin family antiviral radical SAM protein [Bacteroidia bacterium]